MVDQENTKVEIYTDSNNAKSDSVERLDRTYTMQAGEYWQSLVDEPKCDIEAGKIYLLSKIEYVEEIPHTIHVRAHPFAYIRDKHAGGVRMLVEEFLEKFTHVSKEHAEAIRDQEMASVQQQIAEKRAYIQSIKSDPVKFRAMAIEEYSRRVSYVPPELSGVEVDPTLYSRDVVVHIEKGLTTERLETLKDTVSQTSDIIGIQAKWLKTQTEELQSLIQGILPFNEESIAALNASLAEDMRTADKLKEGIATMTLYTGEGVRVHHFKKGEPAPDLEPLTITQRKLFLDEEISVYSDEAFHFDANSFHKFFDAIEEHPKLIEQLFPTKRCILVAACRRNFKEYNDKFENAVMNQANREVFLLARNGDNIYLIDSPIHSHVHAKRLFPAKDDLERHFIDNWQQEITIDSLSYAGTMNSIEQEILHYKRFMILIAGLDHREKLFGEFYPANVNPMDFFTLGFQNKYFNFIYDASGALKDSRLPSIQAWIQNHNSQIVSGSRVFCNWWRLVDKDSAPGIYSSNMYSKDSYPTASPVRSNDVVVVTRQGRDLVVQCEVRNNNTDRLFNTKLTLNPKWNHGADAFRDEQLGYLCLDMVNPDDIYQYIHSREHREFYINYMELLKQIYRHLMAERASQLPSTKALYEAAKLVKPDASYDDMYPYIREAIAKWRCANRGAPLPDFSVIHSNNKKQWAQLLDQLYFQISDEYRNGLIANVEAWLETQRYAPLKLVYTGNNKVVLYVEYADDERYDQYGAMKWVKRLLLDVKKSGIKVSSETEADLTNIDNRETVIKVWDETILANYTGEPSKLFNSFANKKKLIDCMNESVSILPKLFNNKPSEQLFERLFNAYTTALREKLGKTSPQVSYIKICVPIMLVGQYTLVLNMDTPLNWLMKYYVTREQQLVLDRLKNNFEVKRSILRHYDEPHHWNLRIINTSVMPALNDYIIDLDSFYSITTVLTNPNDRRGGFGKQQEDVSPYLANTFRSLKQAINGMGWQYGSADHFKDNWMPDNLAKRDIFMIDRLVKNPLLNNPLPVLKNVTCMKYTFTITDPRRKEISHKFAHIEFHEEPILDPSVCEDDEDYTINEKTIHQTLSDEMTKVKKQYSLRHFDDSRIYTLTSYGSLSEVELETLVQKEFESFKKANKEMPFTNISPTVENGHRVWRFSTKHTTKQ